jgi:hypothetical protein
MSLVGELILSFRELATDLPQVMPPPTLVSLAGQTVAGGIFQAGTYFVVATLLSSFGETAQSLEQTVTLSGGQNSILGVITYPTTGVTGARFYVTPVGGLAGTELNFQEFDFSNSITNFNITNPATTATPPSRSTAYLPDTDGPALGAYAAYRWLNQALAWAAGKNRGGLPDFGAVGTTNGIGNYVMPGYWKKIDTAWFDGYPLGLLNKNNVFRRQPVPGYSGALTIFQATDRLMVECWPQPNRTSNQTTLASPMAATDTVANLTSTANFVLGFGMASIGTELVYYSAINNNQLTGLLRGMCGTTPAAWPTGASSVELNLMISGYRVPSTYAPGSALSTLYLPPGWDEALTSYMLHRFRKAEQDENGAKTCLQEATQKLSDLSANRIIAGPRQIQPFGTQGPEIAVGLGSPFGGVIIR